jgi:hypothetical protein
MALTCGGVAMIPWLGVLGYFLPRATTAAHWNVAWVGLDALEAIGLLATGRLIARGDRRYAVTATLTGTALLVDAWFDVLTSVSRSELLVAVAMAGAVELPLSCLCLFLAWRAMPAHSLADQPATSGVSAPTGPRAPAPPGEPSGASWPGRVSVKNAVLSAAQTGSGVSSGPKIASTGHSGRQAPQSMHSSALM